MIDNEKIQTISINIAYDDLKKPNLSALEFEPQWLVDMQTDKKNYHKWSQVDNFLPNLLNTFNKNTVEYFCNQNYNFIYPILLYTDELFYKHTTIDFGDKLLKSVKEKKAKIVFFYITEGYWGTHKIHFEWIDNLVEKYEFDKDDLLFLTANLKSNEIYNKNKFTIIPYNFFLINLDFIPLNKSNKNDIEKYEKNYIKYIEQNRLIKKTNHLLCFNGIPRLNRLLIFGELNTNPKLKNKYITSLRNTFTDNEFQFYEDVLENTDNQDILSFYKNYNSLNNYFYDKKEWGNIINWGAYLNESAHMESFVNIITETLWDDSSIFFTEKTYKPIYMCQPFIIFGNPHSLKKLKEYGFKTFDRWWDESYDDEIDLNIRLKKITKVLEEITSWDFDKCQQIIIEMEETLIHNFKIIINNEELYKLYSQLKTNTKVIKKNII